MMTTNVKIPKALTPGLSATVDPQLRKLYLIRVCEVILEHIPEKFEPQVGAWLPSVTVKVDDESTALAKELVDAMGHLGDQFSQGVKLEHSVDLGLRDAYDAFKTKIGNHISPNVKSAFKSVVDALSTILDGNFLFPVGVVIASVAFLYMGRSAWKATLSVIALFTEWPLKMVDSFATHFAGWYYNVDLSTRDDDDTLYYCTKKEWNDLCDALGANGSTEHFEPQVGPSDFVNVLVGLIYTKFGYESYIESDLPKFIKSISSVPKYAEGIKAFVDWFLNMLQSFINRALTCFGKDPIYLKRSKVPDLDVIQSDLDGLISDLRAGADYNQENGERLYSIEARLRKVIVGIPATRDYSEERRIALEMKSAISGLVSRMERNNIVGNGPRVEPLGIMLAGPTNAGKSTTIVPLVLAVNALVLPQEKLRSFEANHNDVMWFYDPENPFADAYHGQFNTIIDELGAKKEVSGDPNNVYLQAMRMINNANMPLHMAHLEDKGNVNFRSDLVWATTNRKWFDCSTLYLPEAFVRRWKLAYLFVPRKEYCTPETADGDLWSRNLDVTKLPDGLSLDVAEFYPYDFRQGKATITGQPVCFNELVTIIAEAYKANRHKGNNMLSEHARVKDMFLKQRDDYVPVQEEQPSLVREMLDAGFTMNEALRSQFLAECEDAAAKCKSLIKGLKDVIFNNPILTCALTTVAATACVWNFCKPFIREPQSGDVRGSKGPRPKPARIRSQRYAQRRAGGGSTPQVGLNQNALDTLNSLARKNLYTLVWQGRRYGSILFLKGRWAVMPEHFVYTIEDAIENGNGTENDQVLLTRLAAPGSGIAVRYSDIEFYTDDTATSDLVFMRFPDKAIHCHKDITKYIPSVRDSEYATRFEGAFLRGSMSGDACYSIVATDVWPLGATSYGTYSFESGFAYAVATIKGDCGSLLFALANNGRPALVGMHVSGSGNTGHATRLTSEAIAFIGDDLVSDQFEPVENAEAQIGDNFVSCEFVPKLHIFNTSQIVPSPLHGKWGPSTEEPVKLKSHKLEDGSIFDPWKKARSKYSKQFSAVNLDTFEACVSSVIEDITFSSDSGRPWPPKVFSYRDAIVGVDGVDFIDSISRSTSAGFPYVTQTKMKGKTAWWGIEGEFTFDSEKAQELEKIVRNQLESLKCGRRVNFVFADFLKDERKPIPKVARGASRLVSAGPVDFLVLLRMYFGDLVRWLMTNRIKNGMAVGVNPYSGEWGQIVGHLSSVGDTGFIAGDYSGFDGSLGPLWLYAFLDLADSFYGLYDQEARTVRYALMESIVNSRHVFTSPDLDQSVVYEWLGSNPSGNYLTTVMNSFANLVIIRYSCVSCRLATLGIRHLDTFSFQHTEAIKLVQENVRSLTFGDDNLLNVAPDLQSYVTPDNLSKAMSDIGFKYTSETKGDFISTFRTVQQCSFLKRGFVWNGDLKRWMAPLEIGVILEMPYWTKVKNPKDNVITVVETALDELAAHGIDVFTMWAPRIATACASTIRHSPQVRFKARLFRYMGIDQRY